MGPHQASLGHAHIRSHRADGHLPERTPCRASPTLASSPTAPAVSPFALRFGPVFASGPSPAPLTGRQLPSGYLGYEGILVHMATLGGTPTRWMCALRGARARTVSSAATRRPDATTCEGGVARGLRPAGSAARPTEVACGGPIGSGRASQPALPVRTGRAGLPHPAPA